MKYIYALFFISILSSCTDNSNPPETVNDNVQTIPDAPLIGVVWQLQQYKNTNGDTISIIPSNEYSIGFRDTYSDQLLIGFIGCHSLLARYSLSGVLITVNVETVTTNNCDAANLDLNEFELFYLNTLTSIVSHSIEGNVLTVQSSDSSVLIFNLLE